MFVDRAAKPARRSGAYVVLDNGTLCAFVDRGGRSVVSYTDDGATFEFPDTYSFTGHCLDGPTMLPTP